jgi:SAM-dependent methyltransferase
MVYPSLSLFNTQYYTRFYYRGLIHDRFIDLVHRREPAFRYLTRKYAKNSPLLDIGCGSGNFLSHAQNWFKVTGIDISKEAIKLAKANAPKAELYVRSIYQLSHFKKASFKVITCFDVLEHVVAHPAIFSQIRELLTPEGIFIMAAPNLHSIGLKFRQENWLNFREPSHLALYDAQEWGFILKTAGFVPIKTWYDGLCDPPYIPRLPMVFQNLLFRYPTQAWSILGLPLPSFLGENCILAAVKAPGWKNDHGHTQMDIYAHFTH